MAKKQRIIKNGYVAVVDSEKLETASVEDYKYEHRLIAEELLDRPLKEGEEVHHLDENKTNNSPDNLLVLSGPMHVKLHTWLSKNIITPKPEYAERKALGCIRCAVCDKPVDHTEKYCSRPCQDFGRRKAERPSKEVLALEIETTSMVKLGEKYGVSDNAVRKWAKSYNLI
jgi:hypothetical protein